MLLVGEGGGCGGGGGERGADGFRLHRCRGLPYA